MAGEGFALEKFNQAAVGIPATERSMKGKDFPKKGKFFPIGTNQKRLCCPQGGMTGLGSVNRIGHDECEHQGGYSANSQCEILFAIHGFAPCWRRTSNPHGQLVFRRRPPVASASR